MDLAEYTAVYEVAMNNGGPDGGTSQSFMISAPIDRPWDGLTQSAVDDAVQAFADELATNASSYSPAWTIRSIHRFTVVNTAL